VGGLPPPKSGPDATLRTPSVPSTTLSHHPTCAHPRNDGNRPSCPATVPSSRCSAATCSRKTRLLPQAVSSARVDSSALLARSRGDSTSERHSLQTHTRRKHQFYVKQKRHRNVSVVVLHSSSTYVDKITNNIFPLICRDVDGRLRQLLRTVPGVLRP